MWDAPTELPFLVELWDRGDQRVEQVLAACAGIVVARAALDAAARQNPGRSVYLRHRCRVIERRGPVLS